MPDPYASPAAVPARPARRAARGAGQPGLRARATGSCREVSCWSSSGGWRPPCAASGSAPGAASPSSRGLAGGVRRSHGRARAGLPRRGGPARVHRRAARPRARHGRRRRPRRPVDRDAAAAGRRRTGSAAVPRTVPGRRRPAGVAPTTDDRPRRHGQPDDVAALVFTSGSTGRPQGLRDHLPRAQRALGVAAPRVVAGRRASSPAPSSATCCSARCPAWWCMEFLGPCLLGGGTAVIPERRRAAAVPVRDRTPPDHRLHHHRAPARARCSTCSATSRSTSAACGR